MRNLHSEITQNPSWCAFTVPTPRGWILVTSLQQWINALMSSSLDGLLGSETLLEEGDHWRPDLKGCFFLFLELPLYRGALPYHTWAQKQGNQKAKD